MSNLTVISPEVTMSSREIASLVESRHDKVKQSIERLAKREVISLPPVGEYRDSLGRKACEYLLTKRDSYVVVAQLSPEFTARLVDRWQELEQQASEPQFKLPQNYLEALKELTVQVEQVQLLTLENQKQAESLELRAQHIDNLESYLQHGVTVPDFAAGLNGVNKNQVNRFLLSKKWLYKDTHGNWRTRSNTRHTLLIERAKTIIDCYGRPVTTYRIEVTPKGAKALLRYYTKGQLPMRKDWNGVYTTDKFTSE